MNDPQPLRIGLLCNASGLDAWERQIVYRLRSDARFKIVLVVENQEETPRGRAVWKRRWREGRALGALAFAVLRRVERVLAGRKADAMVCEPPADFDTVTDLSDVQHIAVTPNTRGYVHRLPDADVAAIRAANCDVLLRHGFNILKGDVLTAARHGVWSFHHGDNAVNRGGPAAFWEVKRGEGVTGVTLQRLTEELDGGDVIARAYYQTQPSWSRNSTLIFEQSVEFLIDHLGRLQAGQVPAPLPAKPYDGPLYRDPGVAASLGYLGVLGRRTAHNALKKTLPTLRVPHDRWSLFVGKGDFMRAPLWRAVETRAPKAEFWADPFVYRPKDGGGSHIFYENFEYRTGRGKISVGVLDGQQVKNIGDALVTPYHLSYPFVFEADGRLLMIPETFESGRIEIWACKNFPFEWELAATALDGLKCVDTQVVHQDGAWWVFTNISRSRVLDFNTELHVFRASSPLLSDLEPHRGNPVIVDARTARGGGRIFLRDGALHRFCQDNSFRYGHGLKLRRIEALSLDDYSEAPVFDVEPKFKPGLYGVHHMDFCDDFFVFDGFRHFG